MIPAQKQNKQRNPDRELVLKQGESPKSSQGLIDTRLFTGENKLHIVRDKVNNLWSFKYDHGGLPEHLKGRFTRFEDAYKHAEKYFGNRDVKIEKVND